ncbi:MAG: hypothetical protein JETT_1374 [Candidatus Jettenia ecosi]|uniref:Fibronectin type-III domain-containing protein n=1 Tax=Candidatus Jettenia ecosi TaxID=2494326 RepID=A0A533QCE5_9BACT|nr:MAG: hypothetical protein JETT_1374 [Candidatus Jettenia ecosi]
MKRVSKVFTAPVILLLVLFFIRSFLHEQKCIAQPSKMEVIQKTKGMQIPFVGNKGQVNERVKFYAHIFNGGTLFVTKAGEIVYSLPAFKGKKDTYLRDVKNLKNSITGDYGNSGTNPLSSFHKMPFHFYSIKDTASRSRALSYFLLPPCSLLEEICNLHDKKQGYSGSSKWNMRHVDLDEKNSRCLTLKEEIFDGNITLVEGEGKATTQVNYFKGNDPSLWKENISAYEYISFGEVYNGVELKLKACGANVEKLFYVKPYADLDSIKIKLSGANALKVNKKGQLEAETVFGTVLFTKPVAYQEIHGKRVEIDAEYRIQKSEYRSQNPEEKISQLTTPQLIYGFKVASYDRTKELVIDPLLAATYLGGGSHDIAYSMAVGPDGDIYIGGWTKSSDFPASTGVYGTSHRGNSDVFIAKINGDLTKVTACTYLGGSSDDYLHSLTIDSGGDICVAGLTASSDFPTSADAFDTSYNGGNSDLFLSKLSENLTILNASTYVGGSSDDKGESIVTDREGNVFVTGETYSSNFPIIKGSYDTSYGGYYDIFISKLNRNLTKLLASTYLGGKDYDYSYSIAIASDENLYITGNTWSSGFPTTANAYDIFLDGPSDAFISKFDRSLKNLLSSTYLGGNDYDYGQSIIVDADVNVVVVGQTYSSNFPTTYGVFAPAHGGYYDVFISVFPGDLASLLGSTYLGGSGYDYGESVIIDSSRSLRHGAIYVSGYTTSPDFPVTTGAYDTALSGATDAFVSKVSSDLRNLLASTYLGGTLRDYGYGQMMDPAGNIYLSGWTESKNFPVTGNTYDASYNGDYDIFVAKLDNNLSTPFIAPAAVTGGATNVTAHSATLQGVVNANGLSTVVWFEYSTDKGEYARNSPRQTINGSGDTEIRIDIEELAGAILYYYRIVAQNEAGTTYGRSSTFSPCTDSYEPNENMDTAYGPIILGASYHGRICSSSDVDYFKIMIASPGRVSLELDMPRNRQYNMRFYDPSRSLIASTSLYTKGVDTINYNATTIGTYYLEVSSHSGDYDENLTYSLTGTWPTTTAAIPPVATTGAATNVTANSAMLNGTANANQSSTEVWFEYGTGSGLYNTTSSTQTIDGSIDTAIRTEVSGLSPGTAYYYRIGAKNGIGIVYGSEGTFITP